MGRVPSRGASRRRRPLEKDVTEALVVLVKAARCEAKG
jgi:hypothetical protein